jgi:hypothetical protein
MRELSVDLVDLEVHEQQPNWTLLMDTAIPGENTPF